MKIDLINLNPDLGNKFIGESSKQEICYSITKVSSDKYNKDFDTYFKLDMWGDYRLRRYEIVTDVKKNGEHVAPQSIYSSYFKSFTMAKRAALKMVEELALSSKYRNIYQLRNTLKVKTWVDICENKTAAYTIRDRESFFVEIDGTLINSRRDLFKKYLVANLKGTGYTYTEREGEHGTIVGAAAGAKNGKHVLIDFGIDKIYFSIVNDFGESKITFDKLDYFQSNNDIEDYFSICEYVVAEIWKAKMNIEKKEATTWHI